MHFGENQLSPYSISFSLLSTPHPSLFQQALVRSSSRCYPAFILDMDRSYGFGSMPCYYSPSSDSVSLRLRASQRLTSPHRITRRLIFQEAHRHTLASAPIACRHAVSGLFHSPPGVLFTFPSRYYFSIGRQTYLALDRGRPGFRRNFTCSALLGWRFQRPSPFAYGAFTLCGRISQLRSAGTWLCNSATYLRICACAPSTPLAQRPQACTHSV